MTHEHDTPIKEFLKKGAEVRLAPDAHARMRNALRDYATKHPVMGVGNDRLHVVKGARMTPSPVYQNIFHSSMPIIAGLLIAVFVGGGVSYAAEGALPGEVLYPIKVHVNESVRETLALSSEAKANVEADIASRRVAEAKELVVQGTLSTSTVAELKVTFEDHAKRARKVAREARNDDNPKRAEDVHTFVDARLTADAEVLREIEDIVVSGRIHTYVRDDQDKRGKNKRADNEENDDDSRIRIDMDTDDETTVSASLHATSSRTEDDRRSEHDDTSDPDDDGRTHIETDARINLDL